MIIDHNRVICQVKKRGFFMILFDPLWQTLKEKQISQYRLIKDYHISAGQLSRLRANNNVSTYTINTLCSILNCRVEDILVYKKDDTEN